jgi:hypothetical protein
MAIRWYICPYDIVVRSGRPRRVPAMRRYAKYTNNPQNIRWAEVECLNNHILVKVDAPLNQYAQIDADPDFHELPKPIPVAQQRELTNRLELLGYGLAEIQATEMQHSALLDMLVSNRHKIEKNTAGDGIRVVNEKLATHKTIADLDRELAG